MDDREFVTGASRRAIEGGWLERAMIRARMLVTPGWELPAGLRRRSLIRHEFMGAGWFATMEDVCAHLDHPQADRCLRPRSEHRA